MGLEEEDGSLQVQASPVTRRSKGVGGRKQIRFGDEGC